MQHRRLHGMEANGGADWIILTKGTEAFLQMWDENDQNAVIFVM